MGTKALAEHLTIDELYARYRGAREVPEKQRWHALWLVAGGRTRREAAALLGVAPCTVIRWAEQYERLGPDGVQDRRRHNLGRARLLSQLSAEQVGELRALLDSGQAPAAVGGGLWTGRKVARWLEPALGRPPDSMHEKQGWRVLKQLGYSRQRPRPRHPQASSEAQEAFKKRASPQP